MRVELRGAAWALALCAACLTAPFWDLGRPLLEVDDARYAEVPREMAASGDWAVPRLNDLPYVEKPPLWYWLAAASYSVFGVSEAAARLPLALLSCAGMLILIWLGTWLYGRDTALSGAVALMSCAFWFFLSHFITPDLPLAVALLAQTAFLLRCLIRPEDARWASPAAWACAGAGLLAKGLVALLLPALWLAAVFLAVPAWRRAYKGLFSAWGLAAFLVIAAPWFLIMEQRRPGFFHFFFVEQHFQRFLTSKYNRPGPVYYFVPVLIGGLLPWTPAALAALVPAWKKRKQEPEGAALLLWAGVVFAFFSLSSSKLVTYVLPAVPHLCLLAARAVEKGLPGWSRKLALGLGSMFLTAAVVSPFASQVPPEAWPWGPVAAALLGLGLLAARYLQEARQAVIAMAASGLLAGAASLGVMRSFEGQLSAKAVAQAVAAQIRPQDEVWTYDIYLHGLPFYLKRPVDKMVYWVGELHYAAKDNPHRFGDDNAVRSLPLPGRRVYVVLPQRMARHFISLTPPGAIHEHGRLGKWELAEFLSLEEYDSEYPKPRQRVYRRKKR